MSHVLHNYFRSSTSIRVRIALELKGIDYEYRPYSLLKDEHRRAHYLKINPQGLMPALETPDGVIPQSMAILEYLDETHPEPPLMPAGAMARARVRSLSDIVALDIHPVNNLRVLRYLRTDFDADDASIRQWFQRWANAGFDALEKRLSTEQETGVFCHGDSITLADLCVVSQAINNRRFDVSIEPYPTISRIVDRCLLLSAFQSALPDKQPDAEIV